MQQGWLDPAVALPTDAELAGVLMPPESAQPRVRSSLEPYRALIEQWCAEDIDGTTIHAALERRHDYKGEHLDRHI